MSVESIELGRFLRARRDQLQPEDVGLPRGNVRRVVGLRREEVARLANISAEYYLRIEQGREHQPSPQVVRAMGGALRLDSHATDYLTRLVAGGERREAMTPVRAEDLAGLLAAWPSTPALVVDRNLTVVRANPLGIAFFHGGEGTNLVERAFAPEVEGSVPDWEPSARAFVASLRYYSDPRDREYQRVIGLLAIRSSEFRRIWARYEARPWIAASVHRRFADGRVLPFTMHHFAVPGRDGRSLVTLHAAGGSESAAALDTL
jgi:transcriptional regulator with XRE-family HTH domain